MDRDKVFCVLFLVCLVMLSYAVFQFKTKLSDLHSITNRYSSCIEEKNMYEYLFNACKIVYKEGK